MPRVSTLVPFIIQVVVDSLTIECLNIHPIHMLTKFISVVLQGLRNEEVVLCLRSFFVNGHTKIYTYTIIFYLHALCG